jgi:glycosyltransferase involved in cell wall biosynthesis
VIRHWTINGRFLTQPLSGVQRYAREIVSALDDMISEGNPLARNLDLQLVFPTSATDVPRLRKIRLQPAGRIAGHVWEQFVLPDRLRGGGLLSLGNTGPLIATRHIVCVHDANTRLFPASYTPPFRLLYRTLIPILGRTAKMVTTVSRFSATELEHHGIARANRIVVIPDGHEHAARWIPRHTSATRRAAGPDTIVIIGSPVPHKNIRLILEMADRFAAVGLRIAVAGSADARVFNAANRTAMASNIIWLGRLSDEELAALMQDSLCLAFPSLTEGFGLPALEAMVLGCPAVVSNVASLPEICGDAVLYASPTDPNAWFNQILRLRNEEGLRDELIRKGRAQTTQFSWRASAELYLRAMQKIDGVDFDEH